MKTVEFTKKHIYGGIPFEADDRLECPDDRAALLVKAGVAKEVAGRVEGESKTAPKTPVKKQSEQD